MDQDGYSVHTPPLERMPYENLLGGHIENEDMYIHGAFSTPVEPVVLPCNRCQRENYPNYRNDLIDIDAVHCLPCLDRLTASEAVASKSP
jgi:hypothetical protein